MTTRQYQAINAIWLALATRAARRTDTDFRFEDCDDGIVCFWQWSQRVDGSFNWLLGAIGDE